MATDTGKDLPDSTGMWYRGESIGVTSSGKLCCADRGGAPLHTLPRGGWRKAPAEGYAAFNAPVLDGWYYVQFGHGIHPALCVNADTGIFQVWNDGEYGGPICLRTYKPPELLGALREQDIPPKFIKETAKNRKAEITVRGVPCVIAKPHRPASFLERIFGC